MTNLLNSLFLLNYRNYSLCVMQMLLVHATSSQYLCDLGQAQALSYLDRRPNVTYVHMLHTKSLQTAGMRRVS